MRYYMICRLYLVVIVFFFSSRRRHTRLQGDWSSDVCSSDLDAARIAVQQPRAQVLFQLGHGARDARLACAQQRGGLGEAAAFGHLDEQVHGVEIHGMSPDSINAVLHKKNENLLFIFTSALIRIGAMPMTDSPGALRHPRAALALLSLSQLLIALDATIVFVALDAMGQQLQDRKSTRLNSSHLVISYAVFCL